METIEPDEMTLVADKRLAHFDGREVDEYLDEVGSHDLAHKYRQIVGKKPRQNSQSEPRTDRGRHHRTPR